ncbi:hypothetical protein T4B_5900 [Trichinella pseudospiralis]|uniref:Uncharacterized protein n=1 Tax=Trichinella pseudospiralis TaxID=6337 RepID=A0A0V1EP30_TRIPS|nr:hypothetical protein T4A_7875 [Trichinella pseudospiralis]KRZ24337.1 hypothetical protein T4B_5900 [Trichinella pseudospiralis]KRZ40979.1 hypothetical protein T4C_12596 [Trichinella pseudospiralis]
MMFVLFENKKNPTRLIRPAQFGEYSGVASTNRRVPFLPSSVTKINSTIFFFAMHKLKEMHQWFHHSQVQT